MPTNQQNDFLPEGYEAPKTTSGYLSKFPQGEARFRVLSKPILGWEGWKNKEGARFRTYSEAMKAAPFDKSTFNAKGDPIHFWALVIWNYGEEAIQILTLKQSSLQRKLTELAADSDWGSPMKYDVKVTRIGEGQDTEYSLSPVPHKEVSQEILQAYKDRPINLDALFSNGDPFEVTENNPKQLSIPF